MNFKLFFERWGGDEDESVYWITPSKRIISFTTEVSHATYIRAHPEQFGLETKEVRKVNDENETDLNDRVIANGYARIYIDDVDMTVQVNPHALKKLKGPLEELILTHDIRKILIDHDKGNMNLIPYRRYTAEEFFDL
jgi:hypothetical protein